MFTSKAAECVPLLTNSEFYHDFEASTLKTLNTVFFVIYRSVTSGISLFAAFLETFFFRSVAESSGDSSFFFREGRGDINIDMMSPSTQPLELSSLVQSFGLFNVISSSYRITSSCEILLDLFCTSATKRRYMLGSLAPK